MDKAEQDSFLKQAYGAGFKKDELPDFAAHVLANPSRYRDVTKRRARIFVNIIGRKK